MNKNIATLMGLYTIELGTLISIHLWQPKNYSQCHAQENPHPWKNFDKVAAN